MGLAYEVTSDMYGEVYAMRQDTRRPGITFGNIASLNARYAPRAISNIVRKLLSGKRWTTAVGNISYELIACTFQDANAHQKAWDMFWQCHDEGKDVIWAIHGDCYSANQLNRDEIKD